ncbi:hypothetical protein PROFUN_07209 [Planoprotostelium fungivorum]|uniref:Uncharacterized protein n=1 Tax=Planoprotostelium fungivorum TaxID=1890364 RepID=A0A2P6NMK6_9EUKA|nr:hypothetical protein PROFUN_07209 [Planoprotostelium fungivorum]
MLGYVSNFHRNDPTSAEIGARDEDLRPRSSTPTSEVGGNLRKFPAIQAPTAADGGSYRTIIFEKRAVPDHTPTHKQPSRLRGVSLDQVRRALREERPMEAILREDGYEPTQFQHHVNSGNLSKSPSQESTTAPMTVQSSTGKHKRLSQLFHRHS